MRKKEEGKGNEERSDNQDRKARFEYDLCQGSILGPLIFLLYVNDMPQAVDCDLLLYADDSCLVFRDNNINEIEKQLNKILTPFVTGLLITN